MAGRGRGPSVILEAAVDAVRRRSGLARGVRLGSLGLAAGAGLAWMGAGPLGASLGLIALGGWLVRLTPIQAVQRLDTVLAAESAVVCAWDHRTHPSPMAAALRARVEARLSDAAVRAAAPTASLAWILPPLAWLSLLAAPTEVPIPVDAPESVATASEGAPDAGPVSPVVSTASDGRSEAGPDAGTRVATHRDPPDGGLDPTADAGAPGGEVAGRSEVGGEGTRAGDQRAMPVAAERVGLSPGTAAGLWLAQAGGDALPATAARAAPIRGRAPSEEDISDPARPFSPRYRPVIEAWFRRGE